MIEVTNKSELVPENDLQELWQLSGRVEAVKRFLCRCIANDAKGVDPSAIYEMLSK